MSTFSQSKNSFFLILLTIFFSANSFAITTKKHAVNNPVAPTATCHIVPISTKDFNAKDAEELIGQLSELSQDIDNLVQLGVIDRKDVKKIKKYLKKGKFSKAMGRAIAVAFKIQDRLASQEHLKTLNINA